MGITFLHTKVVEMPHLNAKNSLIPFEFLAFNLHIYCLFQNKSDSEINI